MHAPERSTKSAVGAFQVKLVQCKQAVERQIGLDNALVVLNSL